MPNKTAQNLADQIRKRRGDMSQVAFARKIGVSQSAVAQMEAATQNTTINTLHRIASALKCEAYELLKPIKTTNKD